MSNRSYLYVRTQDGKSTGLCEYPYEASMTQLIMVSSRVRKVKSCIWDAEVPLALEGDFDEGCQRLFDFYERCLSQGAVTQEKYDELCAQAHEALDKWAGKNATVQLETAEIFEMEDPEDYDFEESEDDEDGFEFLAFLLNDLYENIFKDFNAYLKDSIRQLKTFKETGASEAIDEALDVDWDEILFYSPDSNDDDDDDDEE